MLTSYFPVLLFILIGVVIGVAPFLLNRVLAFVGLRPHAPSSEKLAPYECGFEPFEDARLPFDVRFYLVAVLFIIFDLEVTFLFPWAVTFSKLGAAAFWAMMMFLGLLVVGFIYEWRKGALSWE